MDVINYVTAQRNLSKIRDETKENKKSLRDEVNLAKEALMDQMDAAGITSIKSGPSEWMVIFNQRKPVKLTPELVTEILTTVTDCDLNTVMQGQRLPLVEATRKYVRTKIASAKNDDDEEEEVKRNFRVQNHCPRYFVDLPAASTDIIENALTNYQTTVMELKSFQSRMKERADELKASLTEAVDMSIVDFVTAPTLEDGEIGGGTFTEDGGVCFRTAPISLQPDEEPPENPLYLKATRKYKPRKLPKKKFMTIVDDAVNTILTRRFGESANMDNERVREITNTTDEVIEMITETISREAGVEESTTVCLTNKRPRV